MKMKSSKIPTQNNQLGNHRNINIEHTYDIRNIFDFDNISKNEIVMNILGFFLYFLIFVVTFPTILYKFGFYNILEVYLPNLDLIANLLSFHGGPENYNLFKYLYIPTATNTYAFLSQTIINYMALLGLTYIIARETKLTNSVIRGWSLAFVMLLVTYLLPSQLISVIMKKINRYIHTKTPWNSTFIWNIVVLVGFILTIGVIVFERFILLYFRDFIMRIGTFILNFPK